MTDQTTTTPADELRTAAATLRALATTASTDRYERDTSTWTSQHISTTDARIYAPERVRIIRGSSSGPNGRGVQPHLHPNHADYIAAMDPRLGLALSAWLDSAADDAEQIGADHHALDVARLINQETT